MKKKNIYLWIPVILWMVIIFCFSAQTEDKSTNTSGFAAEIINTFFSSCSETFKKNFIEICHFIMSKPAYFTWYAILGILLAAAFNSHNNIHQTLRKERLTLMKKKSIYLWIPVILWMLLIFYFSAQTAEISNKTSGTAAKILEYIVNTSFGSFSESFKAELLNNCQFIVRKLAHFAEYTILGILSSTAFFGYDKLSLKLRNIFSAALCLIYASSDELHQHFVPGRSCQFRDVMIDFFGSISGILIFTLIVFIVRKIKNKRSVKNRG